MTRPIRILGIDPGLRRTGWGVVEIAGNRLGFIGCGSVTTNDRDALAARLLAIYDGLLLILDQYRPDEAAVEATFVNKDATATLKLGQARGIAMVVPAKAGVPVAEYAPNLVKKSIVGVGHGDKAQVRMMVGVNGVGYQVHCSVRTLQELPGIGQLATLSIETHVREDQIRLFGFVTEIEREWFRLLQTVQGVGVKVALAVLGTLKPAELASAIAMRDKAMVARTPGVGPKVAERIVTELKDKAPAFANIDPAVVRLAGSIDEKRATGPVADAVSALVNLGYG